MMNQRVILRRRNPEEQTTIRTNGMDVDRIQMEGRGAQAEFKAWERRLGTTNSPIGQLPTGLKLTQVTAHGPESEDDFPFQLVYEKRT